MIAVPTFASCQFVSQSRDGSPYSAVGRVMECMWVVCINVNGMMHEIERIKKG